MSQIGRIRTGLALLAMIVSMVACGKGTESGKAFVPATGHLDNWVSHLSIGTSDFHGTFITSVPSDASNGAILFVLHCAACHGVDGLGRIGPSLRDRIPAGGDPTIFITAAINVFPIMRGHAILSQAEVLDISGYVAGLISVPPAVTPVSPAERGTGTCMECHGQQLDGGIARVSCFSCHNGPEGAIGHPAGWRTGRENPATFHGRYGRDLVSGCTTCHGFDLTGSAVFLSASGFAPACASCHNGITAPVL
jgi:hypothetical protein